MVGTGFGFGFEPPTWTVNGASDADSEPSLTEIVMVAADPASPCWGVPET